MQALVFETNGHPLVKSQNGWGVVFKGTKSQLQAAGFGMGMAYPGEPDGNKRRAKATPSNGFAKVTIELQYPDERDAKQIFPPAERLYEVSAEYLSERFSERCKFESTQWPSVAFRKHIWYDLYRGTKSALIDAQLANETQFPGQPGCGKGRTTFTPSGKRVISGSNFESQEGNRTVKRSGKLFEVLLQVSMAERNVRHARWIADFDLKLELGNQEIAVLKAAHKKPPAKGHLRLVWSA